MEDSGSKAAHFVQDRGIKAILGKGSMPTIPTDLKVCGEREAAAR